MDKIVECVPNFSEGRDKAVIEGIVDVFRGKPDVKLLDYSSDADHNRSVITAVGTPEAIENAAVEMVKRAMVLIDLNKHEGEHPRMGAVDVIPFVPVKNVSFEETVELSRKVGKTIGGLGIPVYMYDKSAVVPQHENLSDCRKGEFEGLSRKMKDPVWAPDYGPAEPHKTFGAVAVGCRTFLCAFNVNLATDDLGVASAIAKKIRFSSGGLECVKAIGVELKSRGIVQVSMNLTDYTKTGLFTVFEAIRKESGRYNVEVIGSEIIGLVPSDALVECAASYLKIENYSRSMILENKIYE